MKNKRNFSSDIAYFKKKDNQYFLTKEEIHRYYNKYINTYNGKVKQINKNIVSLVAKGCNTMLVDWSRASGRRLETGMKITYLVEVREGIKNV